MALSSTFNNWDSIKSFLSPFPTTLHSLFLSFLQYRRNTFCFLNVFTRAPRWFSWLGGLILDLSSGHDLRVLRRSPMLGSILGMEPAWDSLAPSPPPLFPTPEHTQAYSYSQKKNVSTVNWACVSLLPLVSFCYNCIIFYSP